MIKAVAHIRFTATTMDGTNDEQPARMSDDEKCLARKWWQEGNRVWTIVFSLREGCWGEAERGRTSKGQIQSTHNENISDISNTDMGHTWATHGPHMGHTWATHGPHGETRVI